MDYSRYNRRARLDRIASEAEALLKEPKISPRALAQLIAQLAKEA